MIKGRDVWWEDEIKVETLGNPDFPAVEMDAEDTLLFICLRSLESKVWYIPVADIWYIQRTLCQYISIPARGSTFLYR
jgi:hypothetical protein